MRGLELAQLWGAPKAARSGSGRAEPYSASVMSPSSATIGLCTCIGETATRVGEARAEAEGLGWAAREEKGAGLRGLGLVWQKEAGVAGAGAGAGERGARDGRTVSSFVPSGNVPSTCTSATMSATPACTCRRPRSCLPVSIRVATAVPSRIISSIWVAISAVASGAFRRTPRARRRCATNPTCASCRWSSSRGDRCM